MARALFILALLGLSSAIKVKETNDEVEFKGNEAALTACFGENYKLAGQAISHCFMEHDTHNTCCMMDKKTRDENDAKGNPIGAASLAAFRAINGDIEDSEDLLTPWCTCFGSQVCSNYASKPGYKTGIKFVNDCGCAGGTPGLGYCMATISKDNIYSCEAWAREQYKMPSHATPGVEEPTLKNAQCADLQGQREGDIGVCAPQSWFGGVVPTDLAHAAAHAASVESKGSAQKLPVHGAMFVLAMGVMMNLPQKW